MKTKLLLFVPVMFLFLFTSCNEDETMQESQTQYKSFNKPGDDTIFDIVASFLDAPEFTQLYAALQYVDKPVAEGGLDAGLIPAIQSNEIQLTVFAPSDAAFEELLATLTGVSGQDIDTITDIPAAVVLDVLKYHLVEGRRGSNSVVPKKNNKNIETFLGVPFQVNKDLEIMDVLGVWKPVIGTLDPINPGDPGVTANISASNGMIHTVNHVLVPLTLQQIKDLFGV